MSAKDRPKTPTSPHLHGHLVYTGCYNHDRIPLLFVHLSNEATKKHDCYIYYELEATGQHSIEGVESETSADMTFAEHGWVRDVEEFKRICNNHPTPQVGPEEAIFKKWRNTLVEFLDANPGGCLWTSAVELENRVAYYNGSEVASGGKVEKEG
ncbi:hypothetical protein PMIN01_09721 [Paraphaeosphaeria minitans]|uniref:Uncharacterized protein n=1 Tax=Paraphaeosphaeria minitans TaxID=565426 RepID=A0A9P6G9U1_9PLEO|nr:hypothetical protein PMIN01_09721 [Paraphaeosphaeria minitans]